MLVECLWFCTDPDSVMLQLACARIGAIHSVVFAGFSAESLAGRICDSKPAVVLCCSSVKRGPKAISLKVCTAFSTFQANAQCTCVAGTLECRAVRMTFACIVLMTAVSSCPTSLACLLPYVAQALISCFEILFNALFCNVYLVSFGYNVWLLKANCHKTIHAAKKRCI